MARSEAGGGSRSLSHCYRLFGVRSDHLLETRRERPDETRWRARPRERPDGTRRRDRPRFRRKLADEVGILCRNYIDRLGVFGVLLAAAKEAAPRSGRCIEDRRSGKRSRRSPRTTHAGAHLTPPGRGVTRRRGRVTLRRPLFQHLRESARSEEGSPSSSSQSNYPRTFWARDRCVGEGRVLVADRDREGHRYTFLESRLWRGWQGTDPRGCRRWRRKYVRVERPWPHMGRRGQGRAAEGNFGISDTSD